MHPPAPDPTTRRPAPPAAQPGAGPSGAIPVPAIPVPAIPVPATTRRPGARPVLVGAGLAATAALVSVADPRVHHVPLCPLHALTGLDCPFCGGLRAVTSLTRGDLPAALDHNALAVVALPFAALGLLAWFLADRAGRRLRVPPWVQPAAWTIAIAFALARNLPALAWLDSAG